MLLMVYVMEKIPWWSQLERGEESRNFSLLSSLVNWGSTGRRCGVIEKFGGAKVGDGMLQGYYTTWKQKTFQKTVFKKGNKKMNIKVLGQIGGISILGSYGGVGKSLGSHFRVEDFC